MSTEIIPAPDPDDNANHDSGDSGGSNRDDAQRATRKSIPSREECMAAIAALPRLVLLRILSPAQANSMRAQYDAILRQYDKTRQGQSAQLADHDVLRLLKDQPEIIDLLEPILSQQQLDMIMREVRNGADRKA